MTSVKVQQIDRDRIVISLSPGYSAVSFKLATGGAEVIILDRNSTETTRLAVAPPDKGKKLWLETRADKIEITYKDDK